MTKIMTVGDVRDAKRRADEAMFAGGPAARLREGAWMPADPRIGVLCRHGEPVYYAYVGGIYCEGNREAIESTLAAQDMN